MIFITAAKPGQIIDKSHVKPKYALMCSLMSTSASPTPNSAAGTIGLINVAQLRQISMAAVMLSALTPKFSPIPIMTGNIP